MQEGTIQRFGPGLPPGGETISGEDYRKELDVRRNLDALARGETVTPQESSEAEPKSEIDFLREQNRLLTDLLKGQREQLELMKRQLDMTRNIADHFSGELTNIKGALNSIASIAERNGRL